MEKLVSLAVQKWVLGRTEMGAWQDRNWSLAGQKWKLGRTELGNLKLGRRLFVRLAGQLGRKA